MLKRVLYILMFVLFGSAYAQDPQFSQFYEIPMFTNPAFAGAEECSRASFNFRDQWRRLPGGLWQTFYGAFDHNFDQYNSGFGVSLLHDRVGQVIGLRNTELSAIYSYSVNLTDKIGMRAGLQATIVNNRLDLDGALFGDQIAEDGSLNGNATNDDLVGANRNRFYPDFSAGVLIYSKDFWLGTTFKHLSQPNQAFLSSSNTSVEGSRLPLTMSLHGGYKHPLVYNQNPKYAKEITLTPAFLYRHQRRFDQLDVGLYLTYEPIIFGLWYRGLPGIKQPDNNTDKRFINQDAFITQIGFGIDNMSFSYSYDLTISSLTPGSGGSHEIAMAYVFCMTQGPKKGKVPKHHIQMPCPIHYKQKAGFKLHH